MDLRILSFVANLDPILGVFLCFVRLLSMSSVFRPLLVTRQTTLSSGLIISLTCFVFKLAIGAAEAGSGKTPSYLANSLPAWSMASSDTDTASPLESFNACNANSPYTGSATRIAVASVSPFIETGRASPFMNACVMGANPSACTPIRRGVLVIMPSFSISRKPFHNACNVVPLPIATMIQSGTSFCSTSSYEMVFKPSIDNGFSSVVAWYQPISCSSFSARLIASSIDPSPWTILASYTIIWASFPMSTALGTMRLQLRSTLAEYAAIDAPWFPFVAHTIVSYPLLVASLIMRDADRSLKLLVGFRVSSFRNKFFIFSDSDSRCALCSGVPPSPRLTIWVTGGSTGL